ncbi:MAG TPA: D-alanine--D-alanine ligase family protein [Candidatus Saccharimonadales bacterium]|nr:D-alanine--D-alanine ligase family protein [Candidatus Saccharimonadales bacterium]
MKTVAVIFGGRSTEHDVSIVTAIASVIKPLELTKQYKVEAVYISKDGSWYWDEKLKDIQLYQSGEIDDFMRKAPKIHLLFDNGLILVKSSQFAGRKLYKKIDLVFPAMHGTHGEDGDLMGLLEMANVPYVGCGVAASAVAMDKVLAKMVTGSAGIASPKWLSLFSKDITPKDIKTISSELKYPLFVKPAHMGSSIGISRVGKESELMNALEVAMHYDDRVIVEEAVDNLVEVTLPIIGNEELTPALLEQPLTNSEDFFDFDTKYIGNGKKTGGKKIGGKRGSQGYSRLPADLPKELYQKAEQIGLNAYKTLGCSGIARVDMLIDTKAGKVFFNEINPLPGSLYAHNWRLAGISNTELVSRLVNLAQERWGARQKLATSFTTNFLKQF